MSKLSIEVERISGADKPKENPYDYCPRCKEREEKGWYGKCVSCKRSWSDKDLRNQNRYQNITRNLALE